MPYLTETELSEMHSQSRRMERKVDAFVEAIKGILFEVSPIGESEMDSRGAYCGMFKVFGNRLEALAAALKQAEKGV